MSKELNELRELILLVGQNNYAKGVLLENGVGGKNSKLGKLYEGIGTGQITSDDEAAAQLYPNESSSSYRKLKFTLREKLINAIFDLDLKSTDHNEYQKAYYECHKNWAAAKILLGKNANAAAISLSIKLFKQAEYFEFTALSLDIASILRLHFGIKEGNVDKYKMYSQRFDHHMELYYLEGKAEQLYLDVIVPEVTSKEIRSSAIESMHNAYQQTLNLVQKGNSYRLNLYVALVQLTYLFAKKDYGAALAQCQLHLDYFQSKAYEAHVPLQILYYQKMICLFNLRRYDEGAALAQRCRLYMTVGTYNWFKCKEMFIQMALYNQKYDQALELYHLATNHPRFSLLPENVTEVWMVLKAHLHFLIVTQRLTPNGKKTAFKAFRIHKFNNETLLYSKDKRGLNIAIQIIQFVILLVENKRAEAIDQVEALEQYAYRHLRKEEYQRSRIFIKMLTQIPLSGFDQPSFKQKNEPMFKKLQAHETSSSSHTDIEFIPYEHIWSILCDLFMKKPTQTFTSSLLLFYFLVSVNLSFYATLLPVC